MRRIAAVSLLVVPAAACSSESDGDVLSPRDEGKGQEYAAAISAASQKDDPDDDNDMTFSPDAADCYGQAFVEVLGVERLEAAVTPENTPSGQAFLDVVTQCAIELSGGG